MTIDEKRLAEIRDAAARSDGRARTALFDLLAMFDEERKRADEQYDRAEDLDATVAGLRLAIVDGICDDDEDDETVRLAKRQHDDATQVEVMRSDVVYARAEAEAAEKRAEDAERKLAALVASVASVRVEVSTSEPDVREVLRALDDAQRAFSALREAQADAAPVAERHDREVRAKELRRIAVSAAKDGMQHGAQWLRDEADRIERGEA